MTRRIVAITLLVLAVALVWGQETTTRRLTPDELKMLISGSEKFFFLDVREPKELEEWAPFAAT